MRIGFVFGNGWKMLPCPVNEGAIGAKDPQLAGAGDTFAVPHSYVSQGGKDHVAPIIPMDAISPCGAQIEQDGRVHPFLPTGLQLAGQRGLVGGVRP